MLFHVYITTVALHEVSINRLFWENLVWVCTGEFSIQQTRDNTVDVSYGSNA